ncbi:ADP-ribosylglycohydrolase family protein [Streptomyces sp. NPDC050560]|uniref:ADP-ribosylglycohydrolase family protein n=1 Tax=Streptomyces sp. NPDC050560 TaxID=3365630 RepID=UPI003794312E
MARARAALRGLAVGDALGSQYFVPVNLLLLARSEVPEGPWQWTDDTEMACSVVAVLAGHGAIDEDVLARSFALHQDFDRGYGAAAGRLLRQVREGGDWRELAAALFDGRGSYGNGAAMRIAPLGAWYAGDPERAAHEAALSARPTHHHPEAVAGAVAVAVAASLLADGGGRWDGVWLLRAVLPWVAPGEVRRGLEQAVELLGRDDPAAVAAVLGCGRQVSAQDTVPFALWSVAIGGGDFAGTFWRTALAGGDVDTTCAIACGVAAAGGAVPPAAWREQTEPLPGWVPERVPGAV